MPAVLRDSIAGVETVKSYGRRRYMTVLYVRRLVAAVRAAFRRDLLTVTLDLLVFWALDLLALICDLVPK